MGEDGTAVAAQPDADDPVIAEAEALSAPEPEAGGGRNEGARLIALNMALSGTPREETARYLNDNFELDGRGRHAGRRVRPRGLSGSTARPRQLRFGPARYERETNTRSIRLRL